MRNKLKEGFGDVVWVEKIVTHAFQWKLMA